MSYALRPDRVSNWIGASAKKIALIGVASAQLFFPTLVSAANFPTTGLGPYYQHAVIASDQTYYDQNRTRFPYLVPRSFETNAWFTGAANVADSNVYVGLLPGVYRFVSFGYFPDRPQNGFDFYGYRDAVCGSSGAKLPAVPTIGLQVVTAQIWVKYPGQLFGDRCDVSTAPPGRRRPGGRCLGRSARGWLGWPSLPLISTPAGRWR